ncbi:peptidylprolyl isomerase [soil metagenome]
MRTCTLTQILTLTLTLLALAAAPAPLAAAEGGAAEAGTSSDYLVVKVDDTEIRMSDVAARFQQKAGRPLSSLSEEQLTQFMASNADMITEELVAETLLAKEAAKEGIAVSTGEIDAAEAKILSAMPKEMKPEDYYRVVGTTPEAMRKTIARSLRIQKLVDQRTENTPEPSPDEIQEFYDENPAEFDKDESVRARHILLRTSDLDDPEAIAAKAAAAKSLRERLVGEGAEDFATVAQAESDDGSAAQGGDLGEFGRGTMVPEFEAAAFDLAPGEISEPVKTDFGYHLIKVESRSEGGKIPFDEAEARIAEYLGYQQKSAVVQNLVEKLKEEAEIVVPER